MDLQEKEEENNEKDIHGGHWGINPPSKTPPPLFLAKPPLNQQTVQAPLFRQSPLYIGFL